MESTPKITIDETNWHRDKPKPKQKKNKPKKEKVFDPNKSWHSMSSQEFEEPHYNFDSDGEPPTDYPGDELTIIKKRQVVKTIMEVGESNTGKPGKPYVVTVSYKGYLAKREGE
jgi:hypothetical protein